MALGEGGGGFDFASLSRKFSKMMAKSEENSVNKNYDIVLHTVTQFAPPHPPHTHTHQICQIRTKGLNTKKASDSVNIQKNPDKQPREVPNE